MSSDEIQQSDSSQSHTFFFLLIILFVILPISFWCWVITRTVTSYYGQEVDRAPLSPFRWLAAVILPIFIATNGVRKRSLSKSGAVAGLFVGTVMTLSSYCFFSSLLAFFVTGSKATKFRASSKRKFEDCFKEGGQRDWVQVFCNGGVATELAILYMIDRGCGELPVDFARNYSATWLAMGVLGALSCSCGDTLASELGTVVGGSSKPRLITNLEVVPKGTNGGVTLPGLFFSALGGLIVGTAYYISLLIFLSDDFLAVSIPQWPVMIVGTISGFLGSLIDSLIGATFQYSGYCHVRRCIVERPGDTVEYISGCSVLDNHSVNLVSSLLTALITPRLAFVVWMYAS